MKRRIIALILGVLLLSDLFVTGFTSVSAEVESIKAMLFSTLILAMFPKQTGLTLIRRA